MNPKSINKQQTTLRELLLDSSQFTAAMALFLKHHATLHSANMSGVGMWSFEDEILDEITPERFRRIPQNEEHSIVWCIWHITRIEDTVMNILVADGEQILHQDEWLNRMNISFRNTGNEMSQDEIVQLSDTIDLQMLRAYRMAVGRQTQNIAKQLSPDDLKQKVDPRRLQRVIDEGAVGETAVNIINYWGKRNIAGLLLMPATRHNIIHLNEAARIKKRRK